MLEIFFRAILITSLIGTVATVFLALIKPLTRKVFSAGWHYYIWLVVLAAMVLPIRFTLPNPPDVTDTYLKEDLQKENYVADNPAPEFVMKAEENDIIPESDAGKNRIESVVSVADNIDKLSVIWFFGAVLFLVFKLAGYIIFLINMKRNSRQICCRELMQLSDRKIIVRKSSKISSPFMVGLSRPTLFLPEVSMTLGQLRFVLAHELTHLERKDIIYKWFVAIVKCLHWFNPAVYYISKQVNLECEISCDLAVVNDMTKEQENSYMETILALLTAKNRQISSLTTAMARDKKVLKRRFIMIKNRKKVGKKAAIISVIAAIVVLLVTMLASGLLNGKFINKYENSLFPVTTDVRQGDDFNFLFLGLDEQNRADTIMLLCCKDGKIEGVSVPRNTLFVINGKKAGINEILSRENGEQKLIDTIKEAMDTPVNYFAKVRIPAIKDVVDSVGGVDFNVPMDMEYDDPAKGLHIKLKQGRHTLNGAGVCGLLQYRRSNDGRGYANGDLTRIEIGQQFIEEFISQKLNREFIDKSPEVFEIIAKNIDTNYPVTNLISDLAMLEKAGFDITFRTISGASIVDDDGFVAPLMDDGSETSVKKDERQYNAESGNEPKKTEASHVRVKLVSPCEGRISSSFGKRVHPITNEVREHNGIDIVAPLGTPVVSAIDGKVTEVGFDNEKGNYIVVEKDNIKTVYSQLASADVKEGDQISLSQPIGTVGSTGNSTGAHLHFSVIVDGEYQNPEELIL